MHVYVSVFVHIFSLTMLWAGITACDAAALAWTETRRSYPQGYGYIEVGHARYVNNTHEITPQKIQACTRHGILMDDVRLSQALRGTMTACPR